MAVDHSSPVSINAPEVSDSPVIADLYLMRHGQSVWNNTGQWQGDVGRPTDADPNGLTELGWTQVEQGVARLKAVVPHIDGVISSPLTRTHDTAVAISEGYGLPVDGIVVIEQLRERTAGEWSGRIQKEARGGADSIEARWPNELAAFQVRERFTQGNLEPGSPEPADVRPGTTGETEVEYGARTADAIAQVSEEVGRIAARRELAAATSGTSVELETPVVVVASHLGAMRALYVAAGEAAPAAIVNGAVVRFSLHEDGSLAFRGEVLEGAGREEDVSL